MNRCSPLFVVLLFVACGAEPLPPDLDADDDGIEDSADWCSTVVEEPNGYKDDDGCPDSLPQMPIDLKMTGPWYGVVTIAPTNAPPIVFGSMTSKFSGAGINVLVIRDHDAAVALPCDGRAPVAVFMGSGAKLNFTGSATCEEPESGPCVRRFAYHSASVEFMSQRTEFIAEGLYSSADCSMFDVPATLSLDAPLHF